MKFDTHGNGNGLDDLYILPETFTEFQKIQKYLQENKISFVKTYSDVKGHDWFGKTFFLAAFAESHKDTIAKL